MATQTVVPAEPNNGIPLPIPTGEQIFQLPLSEVRPSKTNPRKSINEERLTDLAADIRQRGVQEPILVRPMTDGVFKYEVIFGERRYRASQEAGKTHIPAIVRIVSDEEAYELQIIENLQRDDLHPLDEAEAFGRLYKVALRDNDSHDESIALVAGRVAKRADFVILRLKLLDLIRPAKDAFRKDELLLGHAFELCRLREAEQKMALEWLQESYREVRTVGGRKNISVMPGVPDLKLWIQQNLFLDLKKAPFDTTDATLYPAMGACGTCQFRTGNQPALFADVKKGDTCTVPACWNKKRDGTLINLAKTCAKELGVQSVLKIGLGHNTWNHDKVPVDVYVHYGNDVRVVKEGTECKDTKPGIITWIGTSSDSDSLKVGSAVHVCTKATTCAAHNKVDSRADRPRKSYEEMAGTRIGNLRADLPQQIRRAEIRAVIDAVENEHRELSARDAITFGLLATQMHSDLYFDRHRDLCKLMDVEPSLDKYKNKDWRGTSARIFAQNPTSLMVAMLLMHHYHVRFLEKGQDPLQPLMSVYRVDAEAIEQKVKATVGEKITLIENALKKRKTKGARAHSPRATAATPSESKTSRKGQPERTKRRAKGSTKRR